MKVETFEQTEIVGSALETENAPEAFELIESMGLSGQRKLMNKKESGEMVRCPYRKMNVKELRVYETLFPEKCEIEAYSGGMIPLRVLQVAAHAKSLGVYEKVQVWGERSKPTDPVLVGIMKTSEWAHDTHILARWGEALESFEVLFEKAKQVIISEYTQKATKSKLECERILACTEAYALEHLNGGWVNIP